MFVLTVFLLTRFYYPVLLPLIFFLLDDVDGPEDDDIETSPLDYRTPEELMSSLERVTKSYASDNMIERYV